MIKHLQDKKQLISKITPRRAWNAAKVIGSFYYSRRKRQPVQKGLPISVSIEPTTSCNLGCPECPSGLRSFTRPTGMLDQDFFRKTIDELSSTLLYLTFYFQGEPYLNPDFLQMVEYAHEKNIYTTTSTNAHYLNDQNSKDTIQSGLNRLIISIDGTTQETYESYRKRGSLEKVIEGTKNIIYWKRKLGSKTPHIVFQFLVVRPNEHQIDEVHSLAADLGVDEVKLKTAQIYDFKNGNPLIPTIDKYSRYRQTAGGSWEIKNKLLNQCWKLWHSCVITWDGKVVPCCFDKDAQHQMGTLQKQSFGELWQSAPYQNFRQALLRSRKEIDICQNCTEGTKVWAESD